MKTHAFSHLVAFKRTIAFVRCAALIYGLGTVLSSAVAQPLPGLVGHWQFEEGTGTTTADSSGNGLTGTLAMMLRAERQAVVSQLSLRFTGGGELVLQWTGAGFTLQEAPAPNGPWTATATQSNPQVVSSDDGATFYRLRR